MPTTDQAVCIRTSDYSETSQVVVLLTRQGGVVRLLAKGSKRPKSSSGGRVDLFAEGQGVVTEGYLRDGTFTATEVLAKHDENYIPREVVDALKAQGHWEGEDTGADTGAAGGADPYGG